MNIFMPFVIILFIVALVSVLTYLIVRVWINNKTPVPDPMKINIEITDILNNIFELPLTFTGNESVTVDWGDESPLQLLQTSTSHTYEKLGNYTISIVGKATGFGKIGGYSGANIITSVSSWGDLELKSLANAFISATSLVSVPNNLPSTVTDLNAMFLNASIFNGDIKGWNTSNVNTISSMFENATLFNQDISGWDTSSITNMEGVFANTNFNQDISKWNTKSVNNMQVMFAGNTLFNQDLSSWNVINVTNAENIFAGGCPMKPLTAKYPPFTNGLPAAGTSYYG